jgi:hypothetical protein
MFNKGEGGFKARDLYVWCANASDGIVTATPYWNKGKQLRDIEDTRGSECHRGNVKGDHLLVAAPRHRQAAGEGLPFTRGSKIRFAVSATTRNNSPALMCAGTSF